MFTSPQRPPFPPVSPLPNREQRGGGLSVGRGHDPLHNNQVNHVKSTLRRGLCSQGNQEKPSVVFSQGREILQLQYLGGGGRGGGLLTLLLQIFGIETLTLTQAKIFAFGRTQFSGLAISAFFRPTYKTWPGSDTV